MSAAANSADYAPVPTVPALCNDCGTLRTVKCGEYGTLDERTGRRERFHSPRGYDPGGCSEEHVDKMRQLQPGNTYWQKREPWVRELADLKCLTCGRVTRHALVHSEDDRHGDRSERDNADRTIIAILLERFEAAGVRVNRRELGTYIRLRQYLDDEAWFLQVDMSYLSSEVRKALEEAWAAFQVVDVGVAAVGWDARTDADSRPYRELH